MNIQPKKSFGQHFLRSDAVIEAIVDAVPIQSGEIIVEIGPGEGVLTDALVKRHPEHDVVLFEADRDLEPHLKEQFSQARIVMGDAAKVDFDTEFSTSDWVLFGNLPYNAAAPILMNALYAEHPPRALVIMVQKEQGDRMRAKPGEMSMLSVAAQFVATIKKVKDVPPGAFFPPPKVNSIVLKLTPGAHADVSPDEKKAVLQLAKAGFSARRKMLIKNLMRELGLDRDWVHAAMQASGLEATARAQEVSIDDWIQLSRNLRVT
ncbi:MAG: 16S rRNA (adenine(1518)-N(6)/adenine(1519)-N(6))-dimethyltransferase RsmA [bacterium]|nr:16S rRNA (adenine(1518)-N(6)/adenine(1519)-N(6))-dimethyltransferase RsmA [bacterium]